MALWTGLIVDIARLATHDQDFKNAPRSILTQSDGRTLFDEAVVAHRAILACTFSGP